MRKIQFDRREEVKRASTVAKSQLVPPPEESLKYFVGSGNNGSLVRRVLGRRPQWKQVSDGKELFVNMRWQQSNKGYKYENCIDNRIFKHSLNHYEHHYELSNKEYLFKNVVEYCENHRINAFEFLPITFVLNLTDPTYDAAQVFFLNFHHTNNPKPSPEHPFLHLRRRRPNPNHAALDRKPHHHFCRYQIQPPYLSESNPYLWILKPTSYNRGNGVHVFGSLEELENLMNKYILGYAPSGLANSEVVLKKSFRIRESASNFVIRSSSFVVQKYMERPLLFMGRKFDIRMWVLFTHDFKVLLFKQGYLRTSSYQYNLSSDKVADLNVHLTNNAVQKFNEDYGKYQLGNQLSFEHLKKLIEGQGKDYEKLMTRIQEIVKITALSVRKKINRQDRSYCFEVFGYDFMLDYDCAPWLIEVNNNPCIEESSPVLQQLLPRMLDDAFALTIDQIFDLRRPHSTYSVDGEGSDNLWIPIVDLKKV